METEKARRREQEKRLLRRLSHDNLLSQNVDLQPEPSTTPGFDSDGTDEGYIFVFLVPWLMN